MIAAEGVLIALAMAMLAVLPVARQETRRVLVCQVAGMLACLLGAYINTFLAFLMGLDSLDAAVVVAPMVEEVFKYLPLVFYVVVFEPERRRILDAALAIGAGFALFETSAHLMQAAPGALPHLLLRGLSAGAMHTGCTAIVGLTLSFSREAGWPRFTAMAGVLCIAIIYHAIYNLLVSFPGPLRFLGYALPLTVALLAGIASLRRVRPRAG